MPLHEILRNSAPAIGGLLATAAGFAYVHRIRREAARARAERKRPRPAE